MKETDPMKTILFAVAIFLSTQICSAQNILGFTTIPPTPTETDTIYLVVDLAFNSGDCAFHHSNVSLQGMPVIDLYHCVGMLTVICYRTDTILLGVLPAGAYQSQINIYTAPYTGPDECSGFNQVNQQTYLFQVDIANKVNEINQTKINLVYDSETESFSLLNSKGRSTVTLYSIDGKIVFQGEVESSFKVGGLGKGGYLYSVEDERRVILRGKVGVR